MTTPAKSTPEEIRARFDADVERFSNLTTGQSAAIDSPLCMDLVAAAAAAATPQAHSVLDVGCGAGNYSLKLLQHLPGLEVTLIDLSQPMLDRATERVQAETTGKVSAMQCDVRSFTAPDASFDVIVAASVLHHLRDDAEWEAVFQSFYRWLAPGGSLWIYDLVEHDQPGVQQLMQSRYGQYLTGLQDEAYRDKVFAYIAEEDTPRPLMYQLSLLQRCGFAPLEVLHKNACFAAFGGSKPPAGTSRS
ncbi:class I SAM-dependent methyltransferase [Lignipirellula cremea]|uniref:Demethylrebeccamycin-D-glucose O-methyltransferase n=1 Tax=Lignipirellula cremea TaxID=2528010 RepID=A0A518E129_9BACT|nr:class I SAM-dependent methyltransferase [Lignipirellula cremea]QDU97774.1 Demethylrebeccamycin-D-glucose O-methyltransferase [Lignipirellula cremea]